MNINELKSLLLTIDPNLTKYHATGDVPNYTVWTPHHRSTLMSDNRSEDVTIKVTIDRYSMSERDTVGQQIFDALEELNIPLDELLTLYDPESKRFRTIVECYVKAL